MLFLLTDSPIKLNLEKINGTLIILFYGRPSSPQLHIINQNILEISRTFWNLQKNYETIYTNKTTSKTTPTEFLGKIEQFYLCEAKISLDKIIKPINSLTNESSGNDGFTAEFYKHFSKELAPLLLDDYDS